MCLAIPTRVIALLPDGQAVVELGGVRKTISVELVDGLSVGDYVIVHVGFALSKVDEDEAQKVFGYLKQMQELDELKEGGP